MVFDATSTYFPRFEGARPDHVRVLRVGEFCSPQGPRLFLNTAYERAQFKLRFIFSSYFVKKMQIYKSEILKITIEIARPLKEKR